MNDAPLIRVGQFHPGVFAQFLTGGDSWRFDLEPAADGTVLRESFEVLWYIRPVLALVFGGQSNRLVQLHEGVRQTLQRIKRAAEAA